MLVKIKSVKIYRQSDAYLCYFKVQENNDILVSNRTLFLCKLFFKNLSYNLRFINKRLQM